MDDKQKYFLAGILFLLLQSLAIFRNIVSGYNNYFWFCDFVCFLFAIGFFTRKDFIIKGLINIGIIPQFIYIGALVYTFITNISFMAAIPEEITLFYFCSSLLIHLSTIFALVLTYEKRSDIKTLFSSLLTLFGMYVLALRFTTPEQGINYVLSVSTLVPWIIPYYTELWILTTFCIVVIPTQLLQQVIYTQVMKRKYR